MRFSNVSFLKNGVLYNDYVRYHCGGWPEEVNSCVLNSYMVYLYPKHSLGYYLHPALLYTHIQVNDVHGAIPLLFSSPSWFPLLPFLFPFYLLGNPPCCDRILPLWFQVADKLISPVPSPCLYTPHPRWIPTPWGCPELNIHLNGLAYTRPSMVWNRLYNMSCTPKCFCK